MEKEFVRADSSYRDMVGEVVVEDSLIRDSWDLYELAGLDHDEWTILSVQAHAFSHGEEPKWSVYVNAVKRSDIPGNNFDGLKELESEHGSVPVHNILCHALRFDDFVRTLKSVDIAIKAANFPSQHIVSRGDFPVQK